MQDLTEGYRPDSGPAPAHVASFHGLLENRACRVAIPAILYPMWGIALAKTVPSISWLEHLLAVVAAILAIDLTTGLTHWRFDTLRTDHPLLGHIARTFREHHDSPTKFLSYPLWWNVKYTHLTALVIMAGALGAGARPVLLETLTVYTMLGAFGEWFHGFGHGLHRDVRLVRWLQDAGLLLSAEHHGRHHRVPRDNHYCVFNGAMNLLLNPFVRLVRRLGRPAELAAAPDPLG